ERRGDAGAALRQTLADRAVLDHLLDRGTDRVLGLLGDLGLLRVLGPGRERLADLAVVAVDRERLDTQRPGLVVDLLDPFAGPRLRHVDRLGNGAGDPRLDRGHHADVAHRGDGTLAHGAVEHLVVLLLETGGVDHVAVVGDVGDDRLDLLLRVAQRAE